VLLHGGDFGHDTALDCFSFILPVLARRYRVIAFDRLGQGYTDVSAPQASVAIEIASRERFDILVTDVVMPGLNGKELAQAVTALQPDIAVLFTSGYPDQDLESRDIAGAVSLLRKPYTAEALARTVRETLDLRAPALSETRPA
jgi:DNA-binding NtrC family response regulator